jgi:hypothetical protein
MFSVKTDKLRSFGVLKHFKMIFVVYYITQTVEIKCKQVFRTFLVTLQPTLRTDNIKRYLFFKLLVYEDCLKINCLFQWINSIHTVFVTCCLKLLHTVILKLGKCLPYNYMYCIKIISFQCDIKMKSYKAKIFK